MGTHPASTLATLLWVIAVAGATEVELKTERFEMVIAEDPVKIVQVVTFDNKAGLRIVEVRSVECENVPHHQTVLLSMQVQDASP